MNQRFSEKLNTARRLKELIRASLIDCPMPRSYPALPAAFNAMIEEGLKMSMEDMEDLMGEMKEKVK